jgi:hypothetical protein
MKLKSYRRRVIKLKDLVSKKEILDIQLKQYIDKRKEYRKGLSNDGLCGRTRKETDKGLEVIESSNIVNRFKDGIEVANVRIPEIMKAVIVYKKRIQKVKNELSNLGNK